MDVQSDENIREKIVQNIDKEFEILNIKNGKWKK